MIASQLTLDLPVDPRYGREDFLVSASNEAASAAMDLWPRWPDRVMLLVGAEGSGKTHLASIWAARAGACRMNAQALLAPGLVAAMADGAFLVDDADRLDGGETTLFHFLNLVRESGSFLLLTARLWPDAWGIATADLLSRLRLAPGVAIEPPDDELICAVLAKLVLDRQLGVDAGVVDYIARRIERSLAAARTVVAALDRESLARGRRITRVMASDVLRRLDEAA